MALSGNIDPRNLVAQNFFSPTADTRSPLVGALTGAIQQGRAQTQQRRLGEATTAGVAGTATADQLGLLFQNDPAKALQILQGAGAVREDGRRKLAQTAFQIQSMTDPAQQTQAIQNVIQRQQAAGDDPSLFASLLNQNPEQRAQGLQNIQRASLGVQGRADLDISEQKLGLEERRTAATERSAATQARNVANLAADRRRTQERLTNKALNAAAAGVTIDAKGRQAINKDVTGLIKESVAIRDSAKSLDSLLTRGSAASRLAAVFKFMKALDPTSVVRESEQGQVYAAEGAAGQLAGQLNSILGEGKLTDRGFKDIVETSKAIANSSLQGTLTQVDSFLETFEDTLPSTFKALLTDRIPKQFKVPAAQQAAPDQTGTATVTPVSVGRFQIQVVN